MIAGLKDAAIPQIRLVTDEEVSANIERARVEVLRKVVDELAQQRNYWHSVACICGALNVFLAFAALLLWRV